MEQLDTIADCVAMEQSARRAMSNTYEPLSISPVAAHHQSGARAPRERKVLAARVEDIWGWIAHLRQRVVGHPLGQAERLRQCARGNRCPASGPDLENRT